MKKYAKSGTLFIWVAIAVMVLLYFSSSQTYQQQTSVPLLERMLKSEPFYDQLNKISFQYAGSTVSIQDRGYFKFIEFFIRKGAHFVAYFVLGGSWFLGLQPRLKNMYLTGLVSWLAATGYAGLDEFHQMLTDDRTPLFQDVALDSAGAITACVICLLMLLIPRLFKTK